MCRREDTPVVALADDLSGAAEVAALLRRPTRLALDPADLAVPVAAGEAVVVDLDSRYLSDEAAADVVRAALTAARTAADESAAEAGTDPADRHARPTGPSWDDPGLPRTALHDTAHRAFRAVSSRATDDSYRRPLWYKKCDSLLRGPVGAEAAAFTEGAELLVIAPALPVAGRVVRGGAVLVDGAPLRDCAAWRAEERAAPRSVAEAMAPLPTANVPIEAVRQGPIALAGRFRRLAARGRHPVCDAETDTDLAVVAAAAALLGPDARLLGSGGLAAALGRRLGSSRSTVGSSGPTTGSSGPTTGSPGPTAHPSEPTTSSPGPTAHPSEPTTGPPGPTAHSPAPTARHTVPPTGERPLLVVAGSAEPAVGEQVARLVAAGARHVPLAPALLAGPAPVVLPELAPSTVTVLSVDGSDGVRPGAARRIVAGLARAVAALPGRPDLVLTGGETARRVLDAAGVTTLWPVGEIHHGAVHSRTADGRSVVTRPGSFGGPDSFLRVAAALRPGVLAPSSPASTPLPPPPAPSGTAPSEQGVTQ
ncbi:four-carbon acid sugar kinase family protein [Streptomyces mutabilis]|uniref:four-carbon acid sugar kinase family protein n=1 Tax=Streptomyces mutabilis TaxID=67332 RepID=UPI0037AF7035